jgi:hypothetical protein
LAWAESPIDPKTTAKPARKPVHFQFMVSAPCVFVRGLLGSQIIAAASGQDSRNIPVFPWVPDIHSMSHYLLTLLAFAIELPPAVVK